MCIYPHIICKVAKKVAKKVQEEVARRSFWGKKIKRMSWRVDATTKTRHNDDLNEPRALVFFLNTLYVHMYICTYISSLHI